jgi:demethoxyubiquinone hydroxylase (CLK1/Coq7/Cat5 family)
MSQEQREHAAAHVNQLLRTEMHTSDIGFRGQGADKQTLRRTHKALRTIHRLETMAVQVYRAQVSKKRTELDRQLIAAMENEVTHHTDSMVLLLEYNGNEAMARLPFYIFGYTAGRISRLLGTKYILRLAEWVERKAIHHYEELADAVKWDKPTYEYVFRMWEDEKVHQARWLYYLSHIDEAEAPATHQPSDRAY